MRDLKFGTSGLRGLVVDLTDDICARYMVAFLKTMQNTYGLKQGDLILVGQDLRDSSPRIADIIIKTALHFGFSVENCGALPTPALALQALIKKAPAVMVTGSHIPEDRNGLKFYNSTGEIDKQDEAVILNLLEETAPALDDSIIPPSILTDAMAAYHQRALSILGTGALKGKRIGVYQHSSVARDFLIELFNALGATSIALHRSSHFIPVDTEALRQEDIEIAKISIKEHMLDALISTDGDADRPLLFDEEGNFIKGDLLGILTAQFLKADCVVTPVTSISTIEESKLFKHVYRTKVGSPYVISGMKKANDDGYKAIIGFEANGGVLLGSDINGIAALPTRDAVLPLLCVLGLSVQQDMTLSKLTSHLSQRYSVSDRLQNIAHSVSQDFLKLLQNKKIAASFFAPVGLIKTYDDIDGARFQFQSGDMIHFRSSGNAPELRCYAESDTFERAKAICKFGLELFKQQET